MAEERSRIEGQAILRLHRPRLGGLISAKAWLKRKVLDLDYRHGRQGISWMMMTIMMGR